MFGIASGYVEAKRKSPDFHIYFNMPAGSRLLARPSEDAWPNSMPTTYAQRGR